MKTVSLFAFPLLVIAAQARVSLPPPFTDHGVLQRDRPIPVWGSAESGETVRVSFAGRSASTTAGADGAWSVVLPALPANGRGATLTVAGTNSVSLTDILVGDVWLCGGQSNMEWPVRLSRDAQAEAAAATHPLIRHFKVNRRIARDPIAAAEGRWVVCSPETVPEFTAVGYFFARDLHRDLGVPIGLVNSTWGGTPVEAWLPPAALDDLDLRISSASHQAKSFGDIHDRLARYREKLAAWRKRAAQARARGENLDEATPALPWAPGAENCALVLNNGMIAPLAPFALRGVIWYQGEANADQPGTYRALFGALIASWRRQFENPDLPFYWVQLASFAAGDAAGTDWAFLREAQTRTLALPHTGQAVTIDVGDADDIHPRNKQDVGARLARLALTRAYGREVEDSGPTFASVSFDGGSARVALDHAAGLTTTDGATPLGFELAGRDGVFHSATARIDGSSVVLQSANVARPARVRYAWRNYLEVNVVNGAGLPAAPFRAPETD